MKRLNLTAVLCGLVAFAAISVAQTPATPAPILAVSRVVVKQGRVDEWMEIMKLYMEANKKGGGQALRVYRAVSGRGNEFMITSSVDAYAVMDGPSPTTKGSSDAERARWGARRADCTESVLTSYERLVPDAYIYNSGSTPSAFMIVSRYRIKAGTANDYIEFVKNDQISMYKKAGVKLFVARRTDYGGSRFSYVTRRGVDKMADLDVNLTEKTLGKDGAAKYLAKSASFLTDVTVDIYRYMPDLSFSKQ